MIIDYEKLDSGMFVIAVFDKHLKLYPFPLNNEYLEMMSADDLFRHYYKKILEEK